MGRSADLITAGITTDLGDGTHDGFDITLRIPKAVIDQYDIFDLFAKEYGWTETIEDPGNSGQTIPNPETKYDKGISVIRNFAWEVLTAALVRAAEGQARTAVLGQVEQFKRA
jgi:hypothetical protein